MLILSLIVSPPKNAAATVGVPFDFTSQLALGETLSSAVCTATVFSGVDATPSAILSGAAVVSGNIATQTTVNGVGGTIYQIDCVGTTSTGKHPVITTYIAIVSSPL